MTAGVYITFDVECSMGGAWGTDLEPVTPERAIWGRYGHKQLGLPLITDILNDSDLSATFFVDPFVDEQGYPGEMEPVCKFLLDRRQDVQLHIHPNHQHYGLHKAGLEYKRTDNIADLDPESQRKMLEEGCRRLAQWTGHRPVAFRAGNMGASEETLEQLSHVGIKIDSSYAFPYVAGQCKFKDDQLYNGSKWYGDVLELALSGFYQPRLPGLHPAKPLDLTGISFEECRSAIQKTCRAGADAVIILHSFSLFKVQNIQYEGGRPNRIVINRLKRLCKWLDSVSDEFPVRTFSQLGDALEKSEYTPKAVEPCKLKNPLQAITRKTVQAVNNLYWT